MSETQEAVLTDESTFGVHPEPAKKRGRPAKRKPDLSSGLVLLNDDGEPTTREEAMAESFGGPAVKDAESTPADVAEMKAAKPAPFATTAGPGKYLVRLNCPTPLTHKSLEIEATGEEDAKKKFCDANGISGSEHSWSVDRVA